MASGVNLKLTAEQALKLLREETDRAVERVEACGAEAARELNAANNRLNDGFYSTDILSADQAVVFDLDVVQDVDGSSVVELRIGYGSGGQVRVNDRLRRGRYRALVLVRRLPDEKESR